MFPLLTKVFPTSALELERLLNASFRELLVAEIDPVRVVDRNYPALQEIKIDLNGAAVRSEPPKARVAKGETSAALTADSLALQGAVSIGPGSLNLALQARDVSLSRGEDAEGEIVLCLECAADGRLEVSASKSDLEALIAELGGRVAEKQGVKIDDVELSLAQSGPHEVEAEVSIRARKLFIVAPVKLSARISVDEALNATVSGLKCTGEGAMGSLACGFLTPHLEKLEGRAFPLMALSLGQIRLRDVRVAAVDGLRVSADFGS